MSGTMLQILPRSDYDLSGLSSASNATITIARKIDTSMWREAVVLMRLHAATWTGAMNVQLLAAPDGYTDEDPGLIWNFTPASILTFTQGTDTAPADKDAEITAPFGPLMVLQLKFATPVGASGTFKTSISIDLNLKGQ
jgi:hypothetical protein